jgi:hypothetical protein
MTSVLKIKMTKASIKVIVRKTMKLMEFTKVQTITIKSF